MATFGERIYFRPLDAYKSKDSEIERKRRFGPTSSERPLRWNTWTQCRRPGDGNPRCDQRKHDRSELKDLKGAPWKLRPRSEEGVEHRLRIKLTETTRRLTPSTRDGGPRQLYVRKKDLELEDGVMDYAPGCRGCEALMIGLPAVTHNAARRMRVGHRLEKTEEGKKRLADVERRQEQGMEKKSKPEITGLPDPTESDMRASVALGQPEEESPKRSQSKEGGGSPKKANIAQTEKRARSSLDDLYHDEIGDVGPSVTFSCFSRRGSIRFSSAWFDP